MNGPRIGELFSGYGGLGHGVQAVYGGTVAWHSDIDKGACKILAHRYPDVPNIGDITKVDWSQVEPVEILTGGSPCQDLSHAGKRQGMTGNTRSNLWVAMREAIAQLRPATVVWENVRGAYSAEAASELEFCPGCMGADRFSRGPVLRALGRVLGDLSDLGYDASWHGLRAADVGAAHGRFRVFVVATDTTGDAGRIGDRDGAPAAFAADLGHERARRARDGRAGSTDSDLFPTPRATDGTKGGPGQRGSSGDLMLPSAVALLPTPRTANNENRQSAAFAGEDGNFYGLLHNPERWGDYAAAVSRWENILGRPAPEPTQASRKGNPQLSARFVEFLMGLPQGWVTDVPGVTRNEALKALGNGVVPQQAAAALRVMTNWERVAA